MPLPSPRLPRALALAALAALAACGSPRVALSSVPPPTVRVLLTGGGEAATLSIPDAWEVAAVAGRAFSARGTNFSGTVAAASGGVVWNGAPTGATALRVRPVGAFALEREGGRRAYRGALLLQAKEDRLVLVNEVDLESYVAGVIGNEIGFDQRPAALQAQAVAARTYAYARVRSAREAPWHVTDDTSSQVYRGVTVPPASPVGWPALERATAESRGVVLTWKGEPFPTYYCSTCGGHTTEASTSALDPAGAAAVFLGVPCGYCGGSKYFAWTERVPLERLAEGLRPRGVVPPISRIEWTKVGRGGFVAEVTVTYGPRGAKKVVPGKDFRAAAGLRSMRIDAVEATADGALVVRGGGWGHGVGLCQVGAQEMARRGFAPDQILRYYYPGAEFTRLY